MMAEPQRAVGRKPSLPQTLNVGHYQAGGRDAVIFSNR